MKLVRDRIPEIMRNAGLDPNISVGKGKHYSFLLYSKMVEELGEFIDNPSPEEAADIYEVFVTLIRQHGLSFLDVATIANEKREKRGGFEEGFVLHGVHNEGSD